MAATIYDVARVTGVSVSTVSRAFTAPEMVRDETRTEILRAADELGYRPNRAARGLITGKTGNIGFVVPDLGNPFFTAVLKGAQSRAQEADYAMFLADSNEDPDLESDLIRGMAPQVDGIILCSARMRTSELTAISGVTPLILLNRREADLGSVLMANADGARQAVEHLAALGHTRVGYLSGPRGSWSNRERRRGLLAAGLSYGVVVVELGPFAPQFEGGQQGADVALAAGVTAILAFNDLVALGVLNRLAERGIPVPGDVSVVGFDDIPMAGMTTPPLTTVAMPCEASGRAAVDLLVRRLAGGQGVEHVQQRRLPSQLIVRGTTAPPGAGARTLVSSVEGATP